MPSDIPRVQRGWYGAIFAILIVVMAWATIATSNTWTGLFVFGGMLLLITSVAIRILSTALTNEGASQRTWRGMTKLRWDEVRSVRFQGKGGSTIVLAGPNGKVIISSTAYPDVDRLYEWLEARMLHVWPRDTAPGPEN